MTIRVDPTYVAGMTSFVVKQDPAQITDTMSRIRSILVDECKCQVVTPVGIDFSRDDDTRDIPQVATYALAEQFAGDGFEFRVNPFAVGNETLIEFQRRTRGRREFNHLYARFISDANLTDLDLVDRPWDSRWPFPQIP